MLKKTLADEFHMSKPLHQFLDQVFPGRGSAGHDEFQWTDVELIHQWGFGQEDQNRRYHRNKADLTKKNCLKK